MKRADSGRLSVAEGHAINRQSEIENQRFLSRRPALGLRQFGLKNGLVHVVEERRQTGGRMIMAKTPRNHPNQTNTRPAWRRGGNERSAPTISGHRKTGPKPSSSTVSAKSRHSSIPLPASEQFR